MTRAQFRTPVLTDDELAVLDCLSRGMTRREAAEHLNLTYQQVKGCCESMYPRLGAANGPHAVTLAHQAGLLPRSADDLRRVAAAIQARLTKLAAPVGTDFLSLSGKDTP